MLRGAKYAEGGGAKLGSPPPLVAPLVLIQLSPSFFRLSRTLCGIKHGNTSYLEKNKIIVQKSRGFSKLLFPLPLATSKMET